MYYFIADDEAMAADFATGYCLQAQGRITEAELSAYAFAIMTADFMLGRRMERRLLAIIDRRFPEMSAWQKEQLYRLSAAKLCDDGFCWGLYAGRGRYGNMQRSIMQCLDESVCFDAAGFERFRMRGMEEYLCVLLSSSLQELLEAEEDREYYRLLQSFMQGRGCGYEAIRLVLRGNGHYLVQGRSPYGMLCLEGGRVEGFTDMIITGLLCLAPQVLEIEQERALPQHQLLLEDLSRIFGDRICIV